MTHNTCPRCGQPVPAPFSAHVENLGGCPAVDADGFEYTPLEEDEQR